MLHETLPYPSYLTALSTIQPKIPPSHHTALKDQLKSDVAQKFPWTAHFAQYIAYNLNISTPTSLESTFPLLSSTNRITDPSITNSSSHLIVILGCNVLSNGTPSKGLQSRITAAQSLLEQHPKAQILASGAAVHNNHEEAKIILSCLTDSHNRKGWREPFATNTIENAVLTLLNLPHISSHTNSEITLLTIITEPHHMPRSLRIFAKCLQLFQLDKKITLHVAASPFVDPLPSCEGMTLRKFKKYPKRRKLFANLLFSVKGVISKKRKFNLGVGKRKEKGKPIVIEAVALEKIRRCLNEKALVARGW